MVHWVQVRRGIRCRCSGNESPIREIPLGQSLDRCYEETCSRKEDGLASSTSGSKISATDVAC